MATLSVWKFDSAEGADQALAKLETLQKQALLNLEDGAVVSWPVGKKRPKTHQLNNMTAGGALGGAFWGLLFGLIFFVPFIGLAVGAGMGALTGSMADVGIDDDFIRSVRDRITPGTSALFVMSDNVVVDKVRDAFAGDHGELIRTNLDEAQEAQLREVFSQD